MWLYVYSLLLIYVNVKCVCVKILNCTACNWQTFVMIILLLIYIFTMTFVHYYSKVRLQCFLPSVLWCCCLGSRKGIRPVKKLEWWGTGMVIFLEQDADLHMAQLMPLPLTVSCFSKIQIGFTFLVPAHPGSPGQRAVKRVCVCSKVDWCYYIIL